MSHPRRLVFTFCLTLLPAFSAPAAPAGDPLHRENPRSAVTAFLEACHDDDYEKASRYLDLSHVAERQRAQQGPVLAKDLEQLLNAAAGFDVLQLNQDSEGNLADDPDPNIEHVTKVSSNATPFMIELHRSQPATGPAIWQFSSQTVSKLPDLVPVPSAQSKIAARLPRLLVSTQLLDTPLWKWIALILAALILLLICGLLIRLFSSTLRSVSTRLGRSGRDAWLLAIVAPSFIVASVMVFRLFEEFIDPSALTRLYVGRGLLAVVIGAFAWGLMNLIDYVVVRLDHALSNRQRAVSRSLIYLGRRTLKTVIAIFGAILVLDNWGFNMTTIIAGLGVGGIAIALAAQQTIANVFGGVSVIGDSPVMVGDFGNFGGVIGTVEDIGLRSVRVRALSRTMVSIPNAAFAGMNLENYAVRDKILFNPTFTVKRTTPNDQVRNLMQRLNQMLRDNKQVESGPSPVRISGYNAASYTVELFAYVLTADVDEFYKHQAELYLAINDVIQQSGVELA
jgi:MscS family membrane protein